MTHKIAKLMLEHAGSFLRRSEAVETAMSLGMPLEEIADYLDWLDLMKPGRDYQFSDGDGGEQET